MDTLSLDAQRVAAAFDCGRLLTQQHNHNFPSSTFNATYEWKGIGQLARVKYQCTQDNTTYSVEDHSQDWGGFYSISIDNHGNILSHRGTASLLQSMLKPLFCLGYTTALTCLETFGTALTHHERLEARAQMPRGLWPDSWNHSSCKPIDP